MYTMVLMMAVTSGGEVSGFGHHRNSGCQGTAVVAHHGCTGNMDSGSCHGGGFLGHRSGGGSGFLGLRDKFGGGRKSSCHGGSVYGGSCHGGSIHGGSCHGGSVHGAMHHHGTSTGCTGGVITMPATPTAPKDMPKPMDKPKTETVKPKTESN